MSTPATDATCPTTPGLSSEGGLYVVILLRDGPYLILFIS